jgi:hypothetical protein
LADPPGALSKMRLRPGTVPEVVASLLPKDLNLSVTKYDDLTDEQLIMRLRLLTQQAVPLIGRLIDQGQGDELAPVI